MNRCFEGGATSTLDRVVESTHACPPRTADGSPTVLLSNSFSGLIPFVYSKDDQDDDVYEVDHGLGSEEGVPPAKGSPLSN